MRMESLRVADRDTGAAYRPGEKGQHLEMAQETHAPHLLEADADPGPFFGLLLLRGLAGEGAEGDGIVQSQFHVLEVADAAPGAAIKTAVGRRRPDKGRLALLQEELLCHAAVDVIPGEHLVCFAPPQIKGCVDPGILEGLGPLVAVEMLPPAVETAPETVRLDEKTRQAPVPAGEDPFHAGEGGILPLHDQLLFLQGVAQVALLLDDLGLGDLRLPLERRVRLRDEARHRHVDVAAVAGEFTLPLHLAGEFHDAVHVLHGLGRKTNHEVELDQAPAVAVHRAGVIEQRLLGDPLVDDAAQPLASRLGG